MIVATQVARTLGIEHTVTSPKRDLHQDAVVVQHPLSRTVETVRVTEGMNSAYDNIGGYVRFRVAPRMSGSGGEILRGGYLYDQEDPSLEAVQRRVRVLFQSAPHLFVDQANARAQPAMRHWLAEAERDRFATLDRLYLLYRCGRWLTGGRTSTLLNSTYYHPLLDNAVVAQALAIPAEQRWSEEVTHRLIGILAPALRDLPLAYRRWRYELHRPPGWRGRRFWSARAAVTPDGTTASFDWRRHHHQGVVDIFREQILGDERAQDLFQIVNRTEVERLLATAPVGSPTIVWRLYTISVLLSGAWRSDEKPPADFIRVPTPV